ncbi:MAG: phage holin family protein [bacterium]|nr:phage holin family protein [bacterium]
MYFLLEWLIGAISIGIAAYLLPGVTVSGITAALITALVIGLINAFIRPALILLTLPINFFTLGLFTFIISAGLIMLASAIVPGFAVANFWWALAFSLVLSLITYALGKINDASFQPGRSRSAAH